MPFDVTMKEPNSWVVGTKADDEIAMWSDEEGVATHWNFWKVGLSCIGGVVRAGACETTGYDLKVVPM